jgi:RHS repeat-associated protein
MSEFKSNFCPSEQTPFLSQTSFLAKENNFYFGGKIKATEKIEGYNNQSCPIWNFYHQDHLGNTRVITDDQGNVIAEHKYFPYGEELTSQTQDALSHRFTGHERDFESNLDYMMARYYNSFMGRFLSVDLKKGTKYNTESLNRFTYSFNNPEKFIDKSGGEAISIITVATIGSGVAFLFDTAKQIKKETGKGYLSQIGDIYGTYKTYKTLAEQGKISGKSQIISAIEGAASAVGGGIVSAAESFLLKYGGSFLVGASVNALGQTIQNPNKEIDMSQAAKAGTLNFMGTLFNNFFENAITSSLSKQATEAATDANIMSHPFGDVSGVSGKDLLSVVEELYTPIKVEIPPSASAAIQGGGQAIANSPELSEDEEKE